MQVAVNIIYVYADSGNTPMQRNGSGFGSLLS